MQGGEQSGDGVGRTGEAVNERQAGCEQVRRDLDRLKGGGLGWAGAEQGMGVQEAHPGVGDQPAEGSPGGLRIAPGAGGQVAAQPAGRCSRGSCRADWRTGRCAAGGGANRR